MVLYNYGHYLTQVRFYFTKILPHQENPIPKSLRYPLDMMDQWLQKNLSRGYTTLLRREQGKNEHGDYKASVNPTTADICIFAIFQGYGQLCFLDNSLIIHLIYIQVKGAKNISYLINLEISIFLHLLSQHIEIKEIEILLLSQSIKVKFYYMASKIKGHRRNIALQQGQQQYRFSTPTTDFQLPRLSFEPKQISSLTFRSSNILKSHLEPRSCIFIGQGKTEKVIEAKPASNLLAKLDNLQEKLLLARKQFMVEQTKELNSSNFELNSYKESSSGSRKWADESILEKLEQSTINLESHKRLLDAVASKQRIIWANGIKTYYLCEVARSIAGLNERGSQHLTISLQILKSCKDIELPQKPSIILPKSQTNKKTLVIDLDQTLFHYSEQRNHKEDMEVNIRFQETDEKGYVSIRPFAISFLRRMKKYFEIVAFTASERSYADSILNQIDPDYDLIQHRLYREHCTRLNSKIYAKDLRILGRNLSQVILIDNSPFSYIFQLSNAIPILSYYSGEDTELLKLEKYLQLISKADDVRILNRNTFQLHRYPQFEDIQELFKQLYCSNP